MAQQSHLRPVQPADGGAPARQRPRQRAARGLPSDRMTTERHVAVLQAIGSLSGPRKDPVNAQQLSDRVRGISPATVILCNRFYGDAGWIENPSRGNYAATDTLAEYMLRLTVEPAARAAAVLAESARRAWFWEALEPHLARGRYPRNDAIIVLTREANATADHRPMIENVLWWMEYIGLIETQDDYIVATGTSRAETPAARTETPAAPGSAGHAGNGTPATTGAQGEESTPEDELPVPVVMFEVAVRLTVDDLKVLTAEQIKAFFEAVGTLAAVKRTG